MAALQRTLSGPRQEPSPTLLPLTHGPALIPEGRPVERSGDRGSLLQGTRGFEPALSPG